jgi:chromosome segregation ATPase
MSRLEIYANSATGRAEELSMSLVEAQQALENLQSTSEGTLIGEREAFRTRELDMIASLSAKDDHLEELQEQLKSQTEEHAQLETMLAAIKRERDTSLESIVTLKHEVSVIRAELEQRDKDIQSLMAGKEVANNQFEELQAKVSKRCTPSTTQHTLTQSAINYSCMKR